MSEEIKNIDTETAAPAEEVAAPAVEAAIASTNLRKKALRKPGRGWRQAISA